MTKEINQETYNLLDADYVQDVLDGLEEQRLGTLEVRDRVAAEWADTKRDTAQMGRQAVDLGTQALEQAGAHRILSTYLPQVTTLPDGSWAYTPDTRELYQWVGGKWVRQGMGAAPGALTAWLANTDTTALDPRDPGLAAYLGNQVGRAQLRVLAASEAPEPDGVRVFPTASPDHVLVRSEYKEGHIWAAEEFGINPRKSAAWNTERMQKALDALALWRGGSTYARSNIKAGGRIILPQGEFEMGRIVLRSQVDIYGSGPISTRIIPVGVGPEQYLFDIEGADQTNFGYFMGFDGFSISPTATFNGWIPDRPAMNGINLKYTVASYLNRVWVYNIAGTAINFEETMDSYTADVNVKYCGVAVDTDGKTGYDADPLKIDWNKSKPAVRMVSGTDDTTNAIHNFGWRVEKCHMGMAVLSIGGRGPRENHWVGCKFEEAPVFLSGLFNCKFLGVQFTHGSYVKVIPFDPTTPCRGLDFTSCHWTGPKAHLEVTGNAGACGINIIGGGAGFGSVRPLRGAGLKVRDFEAVDVTGPVVEGLGIDVEGCRFNTIAGENPVVLGYGNYSRIIGNMFENITSGRSIQVGGIGAWVTYNRGAGNIALEGGSGFASWNTLPVSGEKTSNIIRDAMGYDSPVRLSNVDISEGKAIKNPYARELEIMLKADFDAASGPAVLIGYIGSTDAPAGMYPVVNERVAAGQVTRTVTLRVPPGWYYKIEGYGRTLSVLTAQLR